uniref:DNAation factor subunit beta n=1 Tax=Lygus hesperus TaxID=30085 RepID=A0A146LJ53_LYGHE
MFLLGFMKKSSPKGYKVTNASRTKTVGIASFSLADLIGKACKKFQVPPSDVSLYLGDGTLVDSEEYFATIPAQTVLSLVKKGDKFLTGADVIYNALKLLNVEFLKTGELAQDFLQDDIKEKIRVLSEAVNLKDKEEPFEDWLKGVETSCKNKESFMESRCRDRIKSYLYKATADIKASPRYRTHSRELNRLVLDLKTLLTKNSYQGVYFNRNRSTEALCDSSGLFKCQGAWSKSLCNHCGGTGHTINPYLSRETRIVFSTWNLDHRIERSRTIVPKVLETVELLKDGLTLNVRRIYDLLFTTCNLKLVHIVCHDKGAHTTAVCETKELLLSTTSELKEPKKAENTLKGATIVRSPAS